MRFRTNYKKGTFCDNEHNFEPSEVDSSEYVPISELIKRFLRGETKPRFTPIYEIGDNVPNEEAIEMDDKTRSPGFDLVDAREAMRNASEKLEDLKKKSIEKKPKEEVKKADGDKPAEQPAKPDEK